MARVLVLPLPPNELRVNRIAGQHWSHTRNMKLRYQAEVMAAVGRQWDQLHPKGHTPPPVYPVTLTATFFLGKRMRCDESDAGAWLKAGLDQLVKMGIWPDDSSKYIHFIPKVDRDWDAPRVVLEW